MKRTKFSDEQSTCGVTKQSSGPLIKIKAELGEVKKAILDNLAS